MVRIRLAWWLRERTQRDVYVASTWHRPGDMAIGTALEISARRAVTNALYAPIGL